MTELNFFWVNYHFKIHHINLHIRSWVKKDTHLQTCGFLWVAFMTLRGSSVLNTWLCSWDMKKQACRWRLVSADLISHQKALLFSERQKQMSKCKLSTWAFKDSKTWAGWKKKVNGITKVPEGEAHSKLYLIYSPFLSRFRSLWNLIKLYRGLRSFQVLDDHFGLYVL